MIVDSYWCDLTVVGQIEPLVVRGVNENKYQSLPLLAKNKRVRLRDKHNCNARYNKIKHVQSILRNVARKLRFDLEVKFLLFVFNHFYSRNLSFHVVLVIIFLYYVTTQVKVLPWILMYLLTCLILVFSNFWKHMKINLVFG